MFKSGLYIILFFFNLQLSAQDKPEFSVFVLDTTLLKNASSVIRNEITRYTVDSPRSYSQTTYKVVTILKSNASASSIEVAYDQYSKAEMIAANIYDANGKFLRSVKPEEIEDVAAYAGNNFLVDERMLYFQTFGGQLPYTLEYKWQIRFHDTQFYPAWKPIEKNEAIEKASFILEHPSELKFKARSLPSSIDSVKEMHGKIESITWKLEHILSVPEEEHSPPDHELLPMVVLAPSNFQVGNNSGSMDSWNSFGAFLYSLNKGRQQMSPEMSERILQMTARCTTDNEKIDTLYRWLQNNMRYVSVQLGIGGWQSYDAAYVEKNRFGDCKALSTFMKGMLEVAGIQAWQTIIHWDEKDNYVDPELPYPHFNHMMLFVPSEKKWLECTSQDMNPGEIDQNEENKKALFITPDGGVLTTSPTSPSKLNQIWTSDTIQLGATTGIRGKEICQGNQQGLIRALNHVSPKEQRDFFMEQFPLTIQKLDVLQMHADPLQQESTLQYSGTFSPIGNQSGVRYFIPVNTLRSPELPCTSNSSRVTDYISKEHFTETNDFFYLLPSEYEIEFLPTEIKLDYKGNQYAVTLILENGFIHVHHQMVTVPVRLTAAEYDDACSFYSAIQKSNRRMIVLKKK